MSRVVNPYVLDVGAPSMDSSLYEHPSVTNAEWCETMLLFSQLTFSEHDINETIWEFQKPDQLTIFMADGEMHVFDNLKTIEMKISRKQKLIFTINYAETQFKSILDTTHYPGLVVALADVFWKFFDFNMELRQIAKPKRNVYSWEVQKY